jgi:hypothetical protein
MAMRKHLIGATLLAAAAVYGWAGVASADMIVPHGGEQDQIDDAGGTTGTGNPIGQPSQGNGLPLAHLIHWRAGECILSA